jgi:hypothetical protein
VEQEHVVLIRKPYQIEELATALNARVKTR